MDLTSNMIYQLGVEAGRKQMMDHIQHQCSIGKPVEANGELYFFKTAQQNLINIMDDIDAEYGIQKENQYIVPMHKTIDGKCMEFKLLITAKTPYEAWCIAHAVFEYEEEERPGGWRVFAEYGKYKQVKGICSKSRVGKTIIYRRNRKWRNQIMTTDKEELKHVEH